jgi:hypothetical protein
MTHERGITESGTIKLDALSELVLKENNNMDDAVRCSDWPQSTLTKEQDVYATLDAIKPLNIYFELFKLNTLTAHLSVSEATKETKVDVFAPSGTIVAMASVVAAGFIKSDTEGDVWNPPGCLGTRQKHLHVTPTHRLVRMEKVYGSGLKVPCTFQKQMEIQYGWVSWLPSSQDLSRSSYQSKCYPRLFQSKQRI